MNGEWFWDLVAILYGVTLVVGVALSVWRIIELI